MTEEADAERAAMLAAMPPSAWQEMGEADPDNSVATLAKKGGTSKTTFTALAMDACARFGINALGIDVDPQGNLSLALNCEVQLVESGRRGLGNRPVLEPDKFTLVEILEANADGVVDEGFSPAGWEYDPALAFTRGGPLYPGKIGTLGVVPAYKALEDIARGWNLTDLSRLDKALNNPGEYGEIPRRRWDIVFIDLLPGGSDLARAGLKGARKTLIVARAEPFGMKAIPDTLEFIQDVKENWGHPRLTKAGLILSAYNPRAIVAKQQVRDLEEAQRHPNSTLDIERWGPAIPTRTAIPTSQDYRVPMSALLTDSSHKKAATECCQVAEAVVINLLHSMKHPRAAQIEQDWRDAWPSLSPWATGEVHNRGDLISQSAAEEVAV